MLRFLLYWATLVALLTSSLSWSQHTDVRNGTSEWQVYHTPAPLLSCVYYFYRYKTAVEFVSRIADLADIERSYPDMYIYDRHNVRVDIYTPGAYNLTELDAYMAEMIDNIFFKEFAY